MKSAEYELQLQQMSEKRQVIEQDLDRILKEFTSTLPEVVEDWMRSEVRRLVAAYPEVADELGSAKLGALKSELNALIGALPDKIVPLIPTETELPYKATADDLSDARFGLDSSGSSNFLTKIFQNCVNLLGEVLNNYVSLVSDPQSSWKRKFPGPGFVVARELPIPEALRSHNRQFASKLKELQSLAREARFTESCLKRAKAEELWDEA